MQKIHLENQNFMLLKEFAVHKKRRLEWILDSNDKTTNQFWLKYASIKDR